MRPFDIFSTAYRYKIHNRSSRGVRFTQVHCKFTASVLQTPSDQQVPQQYNRTSVLIFASRPKNEGPPQRERPRMDCVLAPLKAKVTQLTNVVLPSRFSCCHGHRRFLALLVGVVQRWTIRRSVALYVIRKYCNMRCLLQVLGLVQCPALARSNTAELPQAQHQRIISAA